MAYLIALLPTILCPLVMGLLMWLMMRQQPTNQPSEHQSSQPDQSAMQPVPAAGVTSPMHRARSFFRMPQLCLNWKVLGGLALVGVAIWIVAPQAALFILPFLLIAACPLSMLLMMRGMQGNQCATSSVSRPAPATTLSEGEQLAQLRTEQLLITQKIAHLEAEHDGAAEKEHAAGRTLAPVEAKA